MQSAWDVPTTFNYFEYLFFVLMPDDCIKDVKSRYITKIFRHALFVESLVNYSLMAIPLYFSRDCVFISLPSIDFDHSDITLRCYFWCGRHRQGLLPLGIHSIVSIPVIIASRLLLFGVLNYGLGLWQLLSDVAQGLLYPLVFIIRCLPCPVTIQLPPVYYFGMC
jgi:hypothetical protein